MDFQIASGEFVAIMGESGAGKSTLLSIMGAMNAPSDGSLTVEGIDVYGLDSERRADFRREFLGFIFQSFHLIPYLDLEENVMLPLATVKAPRREKRAMAREALAAVGLAGKEGRLPGQISGGEKERTAIARAIVNQPPVILADEPTGNLDSKTSGEIMTLLQELNAKGSTIVMVTHSRGCARYADRVMHVADGRLAEAA
jgi:putative ABC transport system ATP-binding protein